MFDERFPNIAAFVLGGGWIEVGDNEGEMGFVRALDPGGLVFEGERRYPTLEAALTELERGLAEWVEESG